MAQPTVTERVDVAVVGGGRAGASPPLSAGAGASNADLRRRRSRRGPVAGAMGLLSSSPRRRSTRCPACHSLRIQEFPTKDGWLTTCRPRRASRAPHRAGRACHGCRPDGRGRCAGDGDGQLHRGSPGGRQRPAPILSLARPDARGVDRARDPAGSLGRSTSTRPSWSRPCSWWALATLVPRSPSSWRGRDGPPSWPGGAPDTCRRRRTPAAGGPSGGSPGRVDAAHAHRPADAIPRSLDRRAAYRTHDGAGDWSGCAGGARRACGRGSAGAVGRPHPGRRRDRLGHGLQPRLRVDPSTDRG